MTTLTLWWKSNADVAEEQQQQTITDYTPEQVNEIEQEQEDEDEYLEMMA
jgi:hypothetical protein|tara:strand:- start:348 stop:497 length:150 start_codon:yes stop_codon:yes gene_type:complete